MQLPPRPSRLDAKGDWQRWAFDSLIRLRPQAGSGVLTNLLSESHRRRLVQHARGRRDEEEDDQPDIAEFGFALNIAGTGVIFTGCFDENSAPLHEFDGAYVIVGAGSIPYPGLSPFGPGGATLPQVFRFTSPFTRPILIQTSISAPWATPAPWPRTLQPGEFFDVVVPSPQDSLGNYRWAAVL